MNETKKINIGTIGHPSVSKSQLIRESCFALQQLNESVNEMVVEIRTSRFDDDKWNNVPLKSTKPYFRMKEKW